MKHGRRHHHAQRVDAPRLQHSRHISSLCSVVLETKEAKSVVVAVVALEVAEFFQRGSFADAVLFRFVSFRF